MISFTRIYKGSNAELIAHKKSHHNKRSLREKGDFTLFKKSRYRQKGQYRDFFIAFASKYHFTVLIESRSIL